MSMLAYALVALAVGLSAFLVLRRPALAETILAWVVKWRFRIFAVVWVLSIFVALGSGSLLLMTYGAGSLAVFVLWLFLRGPLEGMA